METPADLDEAIFGSNIPLENAPATDYRGPRLPSTIESNRRLPPAMLYPPSTVNSQPMRPSIVPHGLSQINSHPVPSSIAPYRPSTLNSNARPQSGVKHLPIIYSNSRRPLATPTLPSSINRHPTISSALQMQDVNPVSHRHLIPGASAFNFFGSPIGMTGGLRTGSMAGVPMKSTIDPPIGSTVGLPRGGVVGSPRGTTVKAPLVHNKEMASLTRQQAGMKKQKHSRTNDKSAVRKRSKASKAPSTKTRLVAQDQNDVRNKVPRDWEEVMKIQQGLDAVIRSYGRVTARTPPKVSPWLSYQHQRAAFQEASDKYWRLDKRPGAPPELAGLGPWNGPIKSIMNAPMDITEEDLHGATHPSVVLHPPVPGSIVWHEVNQQFDYVLESQLRSNPHAQS